MRNHMILYDKIGDDYNTTRKADPYIAGKMYDYLSPADGGVYLDIGCGTGNYLKALADRGLNVYGIDPSEVMLNEARKKNEKASLINAKAENIPFPDHFFNGAIAILTFHHWDSIEKGLQEMHRVIKPGGKLVSFSFTPDQMKGYWLCHYFPEMMEKCLPLIPTLDEMETMFRKSGFSSVVTEKYFVREDLSDHFLYSHKHAPEKYLIEEVRNGASAFRAVADPKEIEKGVRQLEKDIKSGEITSVMRQYENDLGDYLFLVAVNS